MILPSGTSSIFGNLVFPPSVSGVDDDCSITSSGGLAFQTAVPVMFVMKALKVFDLLF
jgi:hypothetical protein